MARLRNLRNLTSPGGTVLLIASAALVPLTGAPPVRAEPVVQPLPRASASQALNAALTRLGRDPRDLDALIDAGKAALGMGDIDAAVGFFARADQLSPDNMRVKAGLAGALVRSENPYDAIPLFAEADRAGALDPMLMSDRGLAYDLVGDNATAQRYYRDALAALPNDETVRRLALSQAIAGDRAAMEQTLAPMLQRQDKAGWRTRAFALAILQKPEEAIAIADQSMPDDMAQSIAPYLRYMPRLTPAQQAAAANFGRFPRAADIGRDDPRVALYAPPKRVATADSALTPTGKPLGRNKARRSERTDPALATIAPSTNVPRSPAAAPPEPQPARQADAGPRLAVSTALAPSPSPSVRAATARSAPVGGTLPTVAPGASAGPARPSASVPSAPTAPTQPGSGSSLAGASAGKPALVSGGGFDLARLQSPAARPSAPAPATAPAPAPASAAAAATGTQAELPPTTTPSAPAQVAPALATPLQAVAPQAARAATVAPTVPTAPAPAPAPASAPAPTPAAVASVAQPAPKPIPARPAPARRGLDEAFADLAVPQGPAAPAPGAVDVRKISAAKPKPVEPPKPVVPSRIWVQVGTGRDPAALAFTWKGLARENPELFRGKSPAMADWGRTNRLLTGPFASEAQAAAFLARLRKAELDAFVWTSPAGQVVDDLPGR